MITDTKKFLIIITALLISQLGLLFLLLNQVQPIMPQTEILLAPETPHSPRAWSSPPNQNFFDDAYAKAPAYETTGQVYGAIVPHHLFVKSELAGFFHTLSQQSYERIILIGPNHSGLGRSRIIGSLAWWQTPYGELTPDQKLINKLSDIVSVEESVMKGEFSISGLVPFIKKSWPDIKISPIIIKMSLAPAKAEELAQKIFENIDPKKTLVLSSVDFSHYLPLTASDFHDEISRAALENFDLSKIKNLEVDSPASLLVLTKYLSLAGAQRSERVAHTNSGRISNEPDSPATSHQFYYFYEGPPRTETATSFLFFGDMMLDRHVGQLITKNGVNSLLDTIAGEEKRFLMSPDIISANLEGAVTLVGAHYPPAYENDFAFAPSIVKDLQSYGFNYFAIANNHISDQAAKGYLETRANLEKLQINFSGAPDRQINEDSMTILDVNGNKVAMISLSMVYGNFELEQAESLVATAKKSADLVVINIHWGQEYQTRFNKHQQNIAHSLIDAGADLIIGHHPHVVQGMEIYQGKAIFYSLGNFIFDQYFSKETQRGLSLGAFHQKDRWQFFFFPLGSSKSQPYLLSGVDKIRFLEDFVKVSELSQEHAKNIIEHQRIE